MSFPRLSPARFWTLVAMLLVFALAASLRFKRIDESLTLDIKHFIEIAEMLFTSRNFDYYAAVNGHEFTYAHLPLFPYLLAPVLGVFRAVGLEDLHAIKVIAYAADFGAALCLYFLVRRHGLARPAALAVMTMWLFSPRVIEASVGQAHVVSLAVMFMFLALLWEKTGWQAGLFWALAIVTRTEFIFLAGAAALFYARHRRDQLPAFLLGGAAVFGVIVLPFIIRDFDALRWAVYGHLGERGDGLPLFRAVFRVLGQPFPEFLTGPNDWFIRLAVPVAVVVTLFERDYHRALLKVAAVFVLSLMVVHSRYLLMPFALAAVFATRPGLIWYFFAWYAIDAPNLLDKEIQHLFWLLIALALYFAEPIRRFVERRLPSSADLASPGVPGAP
jgi:hypothetical protein